MQSSDEDILPVSTVSATKHHGQRLLTQSWFFLTLQETLTLLHFEYQIHDFVYIRRRSIGTQFISRKTMNNLQLRKNSIKDISESFRPAGRVRREHAAFQNMKFYIFRVSFPGFWFMVRYLLHRVILPVSFR
jgi:hypothetical protein